jgi:nucleoid-associated protein YgaU
VILRRRAALVLALGSLALVLLTGAATSRPPGLSWHELDHWYLEVGPANAVMTLLRHAAQLAAGWLVLASGLQLLATGGARPRVAGLADRVSPRFLRSVACSAVALSLSVGGSATAAAGAPPPTMAVMVPLDTTATSTTSPTGTTTAPAPTTTTTTTTAVDPTTTMTSQPTPAAPRRPSPTPPPTVPDRGEVVVRPGDSFWSIAEEEAGAPGVGPYWRALIDLNRGRLVDPSNPDLLYPGQVLRLP